ncbi:HNH endonuclease [Aggregatibacter actinomycetemcomitans]|uniref:HNH endonuclease n=1 Tax=Aggregatibacter actinomycetemcomitans TaxID=714 RepID=UPI00197B2BAC|nr:HNH endonuclease [Aggregatibacter actinomycetemcomitans]MBN6077488.1 HNH endonuclease [Aggregatibacter actinomycetemcomitans]
MLENLKPTDLPTKNNEVKEDPFKIPEIKDLPKIDDSEPNKKVDSPPNVKTLPPLETTDRKIDSDTSYYCDNTNTLESKDTNENVNRIPCRNEKLEGQSHPVTGVSFVEKTVEDADGEQVTGVFPVFDSAFDAQLPEDLQQSSDAKQFSECNKQLKDAIDKDPELKDKFTEEQLEQIENGDTPDGYTWHHHEEKGKMQLVDTETHDKTGHTGGKAVWGGGTENR